jgi:hypothetical protein
MAGRAPTELRNEDTVWDHLRRLFSVILVAGLLWTVSQSTRGDGFQVCSEELVGSGQQTTVEICRPLELTDPPVVIGFLLALGPLAPDIGKLQLGGLLTLERRVHEAEQAQKELSGQVQALAISQSIKQETHIYGPNSAPSKHMRFEIVEKTVEEKKHEFLGASETGEG